MATVTEDIKRVHECKIGGLKAKIEFTFEKNCLPDEINDKAGEFMRFIENFEDGQAELDFESDASFSDLVVVADQPVDGQPFHFRFEAPAGAVVPTRSKIFNFSQTGQKVEIRIKAIEKEKPKRSPKKKEPSAPFAQPLNADPAAEKTEVTDISSGLYRWQDPAIMTDACDRLLVRSLTRFDNADAVWAARAETGMTDDDLKQAVKDAFSSAVDSDIEAYDLTYKVSFGGVFRFWWELEPGDGLRGIDFQRSGLKGKDLFARIRDIFGIARVVEKKTKRGKH